MIDPLAEIQAILAPVRAANPGITNGEIVHHLPKRLRPRFWARAIEQHARGRADARVGVGG